jgi:branched-chain amino acid transport system ATP-binding protein
LVERRWELLSAIADHTIVLDLGKLIAEGDPGAVFQNPRVRAAYFEVEAA